MMDTGIANKAVNNIDNIGKINISDKNDSSKDKIVTFNSDVNIKNVDTEKGSKDEAKKPPKYQSSYCLMIFLPRIATIGFPIGIWCCLRNETLLSDRNMGFVWGVSITGAAIMGLFAARYLLCVCCIPDCGIPCACIELLLYGILSILYIAAMIVLTVSDHYTWTKWSWCRHRYSDECYNVGSKDLKIYSVRAVTITLSILALGAHVCVGIAAGAWVWARIEIANEKEDREKGDKEKEKE